MNIEALKAFYEAIDSKEFEPSNRHFLLARQVHLASTKEAQANAVQRLQAFLNPTQPITIQANASAGKKMLEAAMLFADAAKQMGSDISAAVQAGIVKPTDRVVLAAVDIWTKLKEKATSLFDRAKSMLTNVVNVFKSHPQVAQTVPQEVRADVAQSLEDVDKAKASLDKHSTNFMAEVGYHAKAAVSVASIALAPITDRFEQARNAIIDRVTAGARVYMQHVDAHRQAAQPMREAPPAYVSEIETRRAALVSTGMAQVKAMQATQPDQAVVSEITQSAAQASALVQAKVINQLEPSLREQQDEADAHVQDGEKTVSLASIFKGFEKSAIDASNRVEPTLGADAEQGQDFSLTGPSM